MSYLLYAVVLLAVMILSNMLCLIVGVRIGRKVNREERIILPNPVKKVQEIKDTREYRKEREAIETMLHNIDIYDGTGLGQRDIS